jgi:hypothetical protein
LSFICDKVFKPLPLPQLEHKVQKYETILDALQVILGLSSDELETLPSLLLEAWQHEEEDVRSVQNLVKSLATLQQRTGIYIELSFKCVSGASSGCSTRYIGLIFVDTRPYIMASTSSSDPAPSDAASTHPNANRLKNMVERSSTTHDLTQSIHSHLPFVGKLKWVPGIEKLAAKYHWGNFVAIRGTNDRIFESMPIYAR